MTSEISLNEALKRVSVIGAAGKMGCGIALLLLQEISRCEAELTGGVGSGTYTLTLIDSNQSGLVALRKYLKAQLLKYAEKNIISLRSYYANNPHLISNEEIIQAFVNDAFNHVRFETDLQHAKGSILIFEAIVEDLLAKKEILCKLQTLSSNTPYYFSNTSSIPIQELNREADLNGRIIGFHFYNPPAVQKLVELITPSQIDPPLLILAIELGKRLHKTCVFSRDIAGFIGNGHFIREIKYACNAVRKLIQENPDLTQAEAIYQINRITQMGLLRPMGIFQLIDYVGIDVCQKIAQIMEKFLPNTQFQDEIISSTLEAGARGGQNSEGQQKDGFFQYSAQNLKRVYCLAEKKYRSLSDGDWKETCDRAIEIYPNQSLTWKSLQSDPKRAEKISQHFEKVFESHTVGAMLAQSFLLNSQAIALNLVADGVAEKIADVDAVLQNGFFHLYFSTTEHTESTERL